MREWEEESFLFNPASGDTHLLNALSMEILGLLERNRLSAEAIVSRLAQRSESVESQLLRDHLVEYLHQFEAMGLIISDQSCDLINWKQPPLQTACTGTACASRSALFW